MLRWRRGPHASWRARPDRNPPHTVMPHAMTQTNQQHPPASRVFQAEVADGSTCQLAPERAGPATSHLAHRNVWRARWSVKRTSWTAGKLRSDQAAISCLAGMSVPCLTTLLPLHPAAQQRMGDTSEVQHVLHGQTDAHRCTKRSPVVLPPVPQAGKQVVAKDGRHLIHAQQLGRRLSKVAARSNTGGEDVLGGWRLAASGRARQLGRRLPTVEGKATC